jgi:uncharacterized protein YecT (DUF1311 family)
MKRICSILIGSGPVRPRSTYWSRCSIAGIFVVSFIVGVFSSASISRAGSTGPSRVVTCHPEEVLFKGTCVARSECCVENVCPLGMVFEFIDEPLCVPCSETRTQSAASYCASKRVIASDQALDGAYRDLLQKYPQQGERLRGIKQAWVAFRDQFCEAYAARYKGGTAEREVVGRCRLEETKRQIERLQTLGKEWSLR